MSEVEVFSIPLIVRGDIVSADEIEFSGRNQDVSFAGPDISRHLDKLPLRDPAAMRDLYDLTFDDIVEFLAALGKELDFETNIHVQEAYRLALRTSGLTRGILEQCYRTLGMAFEPPTVRQQGELCIGREYLDGWATFREAPGYTLSIRAFGARSLHIIAGNVPGVSALTVVRNAITRSDMIVKTPSNDPLTAAAIARTMIDMAPDHPITRHISVGYWKGGDAAVEDELYRPANIEKIVAWGGLASVKHIAGYIQPGIDLITLDPKLSSTIIGRDAFQDETTMRNVASRLALDVGAYNQQACVSARVAYVETGVDEAGLRTANRFGEFLHEAILTLPETVSGAARALSAELVDEIEGLRYVPDSYRIIGGDERGGVIVSQTPDPVDFSAMLNDRVVNLVPVDDLDIAVKATNSYTQTIGVYPEALISCIRDKLAFQGAQRMVSLGHAPTPPVIGPADGIEPLRRMLKWIIHETFDDADGAQAGTDAAATQDVPA